MLHPCCAHKVGDETPESTSEMLDLLAAKDPRHLKRGKLPGSGADVLHATFREGDAE